mmetsp:Transcript_34217/g.97209  ORF Transcript_34217/g.97209 Transcript_34217/m.97209 type:complete len:372 (-) Transcript_34217:89-1204(-)|eukprot:CAMPEP_0176250028 /NCGR_PEP_ID=MMETSP0121_2-20121125/34276_1 /TAXON_ID=160619 /ORGANISM="Kryptoperidinium foliaceum, Strain CCMP 1326" /LENGTH=371 /DNA_ID=CAMNT_0017589735 /DNA_START=98 /DNA_END=1213 /DNA_ORIENTATION=-
MAADSFDRLIYIFVKKQFSLLHLLVSVGAVGMLILALPSRMDASPTQLCAKMLKDDLQLLCASRSQPQPREFLQSTTEPVWTPPKHCTTPAGTGQQPPEYLKDLSLQPMTGLGKLRLAPGSNSWGVPMANSTLEVNGKTLTFDDILYGYDLIFENLALFSYTSWFGVGVQQDPSDAFQLSSLIWREQPDLLIELGTNTGGGAILYATVMREYNAESLVLTIDPKDPAQDWASAVGKGCPTCRDVRCTQIWNSRNVRFLQGRGSDTHILSEVSQLVPRFKKVMVMHDGSHAYADVLEDLRNYDKFTTVGSYMVVQDTKMTRMYMPSVGNPYPLGSVRDFMQTNGKDRYVIDKQYEFLLYSQHHNGWLRKLRA